MMMMNAVTVYELRWLLLLLLPPKTMITR